MKTERLYENNDSNGLMDMDLAAKYLCIKKSSLYQICMRKEITVVKIGKLNKFRKIDLNDFIDKNTIEAENLL